MRALSLSVAITSCPASARQLPDTSPTYPQPITASFTRVLPFRIGSFDPLPTGKDIFAYCAAKQKVISPYFWERDTALVLCERETPNHQRVDPGTKIAPHRVAGRDHQWLAKQVEGGIHQHGRGSELAKSLEQPPKKRVRCALHHVQTHTPAREKKSFQQAGRFRLGRAERRH